MPRTLSRSRSQGKRSVVLRRTSPALPNRLLGHPAVAGARPVVLPAPPVELPEHLEERLSGLGRPLGTIARQPVQSWADGYRVG